MNKDKVKEYIEQAMDNMGYYESFEDKKQANQAYRYLYEAIAELNK